MGGGPSKQESDAERHKVTCDPTREFAARMSSLDSLDSTIELIEKDHVCYKSNIFQAGPGTPVNRNPYLKESIDMINLCVARDTDVNAPGDSFWKASNLVIDKTMVCTPVLSAATTYTPHGSHVCASTLAGAMSSERFLSNYVDATLLDGRR